MICDRTIPMLDSTNSWQNNQNLSWIGCRMWILWLWFLRREMAIAFSFVKSTSAIAIYFALVTRRPQSITAGSVAAYMKRRSWHFNLFPYVLSDVAGIPIFFQNSQGAQQRSRSISVNCRILEEAMLTLLSSS